MNLRELLQSLFNHLGVDWVLVLLILLSVISLAVIVDRYLFFRKRDVDVNSVKKALLSNKFSGVYASQIMEVEVGKAIIDKIDTISIDDAELIASSKISEMRLFYTKRLSFLGTLGSNAPYIGLLGTVIGIMGAFYNLRSLATSANKTEMIMISISEALVATAMGLLVAIPAVIAYNYFNRKVKIAQERTYSIVDSILLEKSYLKNQDKKINEKKRTS